MLFNIRYLCQWSSTRTYHLLKIPSKKAIAECWRERRIDSIKMRVVSECSVTCCVACNRTKKWMDVASRSLGWRLKATGTLASRQGSSKIQISWARPSPRHSQTGVCQPYKGETPWYTCLSAWCGRASATPEVKEIPDCPIHNGSNCSLYISFHPQCHSSKSQGIIVKAAIDQTRIFQNEYQSIRSKNHSRWDRCVIDF